MKFKVSNRERWILAMLPTIAIGGIYFFWIANDYSAELDKQQQRLTAASVPLPPPAASQTLAKAKASLAETKKALADREARITALETRIAEFARGPLGAGESRDSARVIEKVEAVFARNGITPLISAAASDAHGGNQAPAPLVSLLANKTENDKAGESKTARVWHFIFDDTTARFERALKDLTRESPSVVPLSMNLVYNPDNDGETRLLELWLVY